MYNRHPVYSNPYHDYFYSQASRLSMNIRALTVERGISTLAEQSHLSTLFSFSSRVDRNRRNAGVQVGLGEVGAGSATPGVPARQGEEELEGGFFDDEDDDVWFEERHDNEDDEEIVQEDRSIFRPGDVERSINM